MRRRLAAVLVTGALAGLLAGCGGGGSEPEDVPTTLHPSTDAPEPSDSPEPSQDGTELPENVQQATEDLAERLGVGPDDIDAGPLHEVTWSDGSLGCPEPGMSYPQALTEGYRVILTADGEEYAYHSGADGELVYCADPMDPVSDGAEAS